MTKVIEDEKCKILAMLKKIRLARAKERSHANLEPWLATTNKKPAITAVNAEYYVENILKEVLKTMDIPTRLP